MRSIVVALFLLVLLGGCETAEHGTAPTIAKANMTPAEVAARPSAAPDFTPASTPTATELPAPTAAPTETLPPTATATPLPTPTPTAVPITASGDPRAAILHEPSAGNGAVCGLVDLFDFPLDPPHARTGARGGNDFGVYREEFGGLHAAEDWWSSRGNSTLGTSVHSIGHGQVTFAEARGWGRDKGVIIVRHTFGNGRTLLSFYGHLDPDSFTVAAGDCVARGDQIGKIGRPRTGPHLHFEVRTHMPLETGAGYWPEDPELAGWKPPSATIWNSRMAASPGVLWTRPFARHGVRGAGLLDGQTFVTLNGAAAVGINTADGSERWRLSVPENVEVTALDVETRQIYTANQLGEVSAYALPDSGDGSEPNLLWTADLDLVGLPTLMPLPGAGVVLGAWERLAALSPNGTPLWEADLETRHYDWLVSGDTLVVSTTDSDRPLWTSDMAGIQRWDSDTGGRPAAAGEDLFLYKGNTLYSLDLATQSINPLLSVPGVNLQTGDSVPLAGGGLLVTHSDPFDQKLLALDAGGSLLWDRSIAALVNGKAKLFAAGNELFLVTRNRIDSGSEVAIYTVNLEEARLTHLFSGGTRYSLADQTTLHDLGNGRLLIDIDGRSLTVLDIRQAQQ